MSDQAERNGKSQKQLEKEARLAEALRANLRRRKDQARKQADQEPDGDAE